MKKPKTEIRYPKEGSNAENNSAFWAWEPESSAGVSELKEGVELPSSPPPRDLLERTARFAEAIVRFARQIPRGPVTNRRIDQVVGGGSSVAANYCEADDALSGRDFKKCIGICRKESKETMLFLRLIGTTCEDLAPEARNLSLARGQGDQSHLWFDVEKMKQLISQSPLWIRSLAFVILSGFEFRASDLQRV